VPDVSVVISTYNHPKWLEKVLWGYEIQEGDPLEIIISDDGSGEETLGIIENFKKSSKHQVVHSWHKDDGYQRQKILNQTLQMVSTPYVIMTDGDCVPRKDFVATHLKYAERGWFLSGGYCKLDMDLSRRLTQEDIQGQCCFDIAWMKNAGLSGGSQKFKIGLSKTWAGLVDKLTPTKATWNNCNSSGWTEDLLAVNGYNEDMKYGGSDRELGERLWNLGLKSKQIRHQAICLHLDHKRGYRNEADVKDNLKRRQDVINLGIVSCANGIEKLSEPSPEARSQIR